VLIQCLPLVLAFLGKARGWVFAQSAIAFGMFALAEVQSDGRGTLVLLILTAITLVATLVLSALLAFAGYHWRARSPRVTNIEVV
jgi:hypothetical protein